MKAVATLDRIAPSATSTVDVSGLEIRFREAMDDDLNSPVAISVLFDWVRIINQLHDGSQTISKADLEQLKKLVSEMVFDILGLRDERKEEADDLVSPLVKILLDIRAQAKQNRDWTTSDNIRDSLAAIGIKVKDNKEGGSDFELNG